MVSSIQNFPPGTRQQTGTHRLVAREKKRRKLTRKAGKSWTLRSSISTAKHLDGKSQKIYKVFLSLSALSRWR